MQHFTVDGPGQRSATNESLQPSFVSLHHPTIPSVREQPTKMQHLISPGSDGVPVSKYSPTRMYQYCRSSLTRWAVAICVEARRRARAKAGACQHVQADSCHTQFLVVDVSCLRDLGVVLLLQNTYRVPASISNGGIGNRSKEAADVKNKDYR